MFNVTINAVNYFVVIMANVVHMQLIKRMRELILKMYEINSP